MQIIKAEPEKFDTIKRITHKTAGLFNQNNLCKRPYDRLRGRGGCIGQRSNRRSYLRYSRQQCGYDPRCRRKASPSPRGSG